MKKILTLGLLGLCLSLQAQEQTQYAYSLKNTPAGVDAYGLATYYYAGRKAFNLRNYVLCKTDSIVDFKVNPSGSSYLIISKAKGKKAEAVIYDLWRAGKEIVELEKLPFEPQAACYRADARQVMLAGTDGKVYAYEAISGKPGVVLTLSQPATGLTVSPNDYLLAAVCGDATVEVWNLQSQTLRQTLQTTAPVRQIDFSADGLQMAVLTADSKLTLYDTRTFQVAQTIDALGYAIGCSFHPEGKHLAVITGSSRIMVLNLLNPKKREYVDADDADIRYLRFVRPDKQGHVYLAYNTAGSMNFRNMDYLSPLRSKLIADVLQEKMDEWVKQMPGETLEAYQMRVNDLTRTEQMKLFEQEITTQMVMDEYGLAGMKMGAYNAESQMLSVGLGNLPDIFLSVPEEDVAAFMEPGNLEFRNVKYALNQADEFEMVYADVYNKASGKTYTYNNTEGQFLDYITDETNFTPLKLVQQSMMDEGNLAGLKENVVNEAKEQNQISDHTSISVRTHILPGTDAAGRSVRNYQVGVSYTVDQAFSASEDYAGGKYKMTDSHAGMAMLKIMKQALEQDFAKYVVPGKRLRIKISGTADATPVRGVIKYDGCYGDFEKEPISRSGVLSNITVTAADGITDNDQLAFLRAVGVKDYLYREVPSIREMQTTVDYDITVSAETGSEHRKVSVELTFEDAFDK